LQECQNLRLFVELLQYFIINWYSVRSHYFLKQFIPVVTLEITLVTVTENKCQFKCMAEVKRISYLNK